MEAAAETLNGIIEETVLSRIESGEDRVTYVLNDKSYDGIYLHSIYEDVGEITDRERGILFALGLKTDMPGTEVIHKGKDFCCQNTR